VKGPSGKVASGGGVEKNGREKEMRKSKGIEGNRKGQNAWKRKKK
jgi:hypothetical protein